VVQLHRSKERFEDSGFQIVLVGLGKPEQAEKFRKEFSLTFPVICDPEKDLYRTFGLGRGTLSSMTSPRVLLKGLGSITRGHTPGIPQGNVLQLPGVFLIDTRGNIRYAHYAKNPADYPPVDSLLALKAVLEQNT
jgi:peroxiredoxin